MLLRFLRKGTFTGHTIRPLAYPEAFKQDQAVFPAQVWFGVGGKLIMNFRNRSEAEWFTTELKLGLEV
jgi:hypothetical protein